MVPRLARRDHTKAGRRPNQPSISPPSHTGLINIFLIKNPLAAIYAHSKEPHTRSYECDSRPQEDITHRGEILTMSIKS